MTHQLSESLLHKPNLVALAATVARVASVAMARPTEAKIVNPTAAIRIVVNHGFTELDLNHDGVNNFQFANRYGTPLRLHFERHTRS